MSDDRFKIVSLLVMTTTLLALATILVTLK